MRKIVEYYTNYYLFSLESKESKFKAKLIRRKRFVAQMVSKASLTMPTSEKLIAALGRFKSAESEHEEYYRKLMGLFDPIAKPKPGDWLSEHKESGQTFEQFAKSDFRRVRQNQKTIYVQPLEKEISSDMINTFEKFLTAYFPGMIIKINPPIALEKEKSVAWRINDYSNKKQYNASDILKFLRSKVPKDSYCTIGCTMTDLYPQDSWNFGIYQLEFT